MRDEGIRSLLLDLRAYPAAFEAAPTEDQGEAIERRRHDGTRTCQSCGTTRAQVACIAESPIRPEAGPRWLDLCPECARRLRIELDRLEREQEQDALDVFLKEFGAFRD